MKSPSSLNINRGSARTLLLGVIALAAIVAAVALVVRSGSETGQVAADGLSAPASAPASGGFIKIGDIKGESVDQNHSEWINLLSVSHGISKPGAGATGSTRRRGAATFSDVVVVKELDKSSPKLQEAIATGQVFPVVELELTSPEFNGLDQTYLKWELKNVQVSNYRITGTSDDGSRPTETFSLNYEEIKVTYTETDSSTGLSSGNVEFSWKVEEGTR